MTWNEANALHNPFIRDGLFTAEVSIDCSAQRPDLSLLNGHEISLWRPKQDWIDLLKDASHVRALFIAQPRARSLHAVASLNLFNLSLSYPSFVKDWSFLTGMQSLIRLALHNTLSMHDLEPVRTLSGLEVLQVSGGMSKNLQLPSLEPLAELKRLRVISLASVRFEDWSLFPLFGLPALERFDSPLYCPSDQFEMLRRYNPRVASNLCEQT